ncbi:MAG: hypothetical protein U0166_22090 [Acidobacteriota bacterium]
MRAPRPLAAIAILSAACVALAAGPAPAGGGKPQPFVLEPPRQGGAVLLPFAYRPVLSGRDFLFLACKGAALLGLAAAAAGLRRQAPWCRILGTAAILLGANVALDLGRVGLSFERPGRFGTSACAPLYAQLSPALAWPLFPYLALAALSIVLAERWIAWRGRVFAGALAGFAIAIPLCAGFAGPPPDVYRQFFGSGLDYASYVRPISELGDLLSGYVRGMPALSAHARTHGPGAIVVLSIVEAIVGSRPTVVAIALLAITSFLPIMTWRMAIALGSDEAAARIAAVLVALSPSFVLFAFLSMDGVFSLGIVAMVLVWIRAIEARSPILAATAGFALYGSAVLTFSTAGGMLVMAAAAIARLHRGETPARSILACGAAAAAGFAACHAAAFGILGFDLVACFRAGNRLNQELVGSAFRSAEHYALAVIGTLVAFLIGCGVPVAALATRRPLGRAAIVAAPAILLIALAGAYQWEVERIWMFFVPFEAIAAASALREAPRATRLLASVLALQASQTIAMELLLDTHW